MVDATHQPYPIISFSTRPRGIALIPAVLPLGLPRRRVAGQRLHRAARTGLLVAHFVLRHFVRCSHRFLLHYGVNVMCTSLAARLPPSSVTLTSSVHTPAAPLSVGS